MMTANRGLLDTLEQLAHETDSNRRRQLEEQLLNYQHSLEALGHCPEYLSSGVVLLQFHAVQTVYWHVRENWAALSGIIDEIQQLLLGHVLNPTVPTAVHKKLVQTLVCFIINSYPTRDILPLLLTTDNLNIIAVLAELPVELERGPGNLTSIQYSLKHHLGSQCDRVLEIINCHLNPASETTLDCFANWTIFQRFRVGAFEMIPTLLQQLPESVDAILTWLESGVESLPLIKLLLFINSLTFLLETLIAKGDWEVVGQVAKVFRLFGELIASDLAMVTNFDNNIATFLQIMQSLSLAETNFSPVAESSLFWDGYCEYLLQGKQGIIDTSLIKNVSNALLGKLASMPISRSYFVYRESLGGGLQAFYSVLTEEFINMLTCGLEGSRRVSCVALWAFGTVAVRSDDSVLQFLTESVRRAANLDPVALLIAWRRTANIIRAEDELLKAVVSTIVTALSNTQLQKMALETLAALASPTTDALILEHSNIFPTLPVESQQIFWPVLCSAVGKSQDLNSTPQMLSMLESAFIGEIPTIHTIQMLTQLIPHTNDLTLDLQQMLSNCQFNDHTTILSSALAALWIAVIDRYGSTRSEIIVSMFSFSAQFITRTLDADGLKVLDALVNVYPAIGLPLFNELIPHINVEVHWSEVLPLFSRIIKTCSLPGHMLLDGVSLRIKFGNLNDEQMRAAVKALLPLVGGIVEAKLFIFQRMITPIRDKTLLDSQVEIIAPLILAIFQGDPLKLSRELIEHFPTKGETIKKMAGCRMPRLFARLLFQLR